MMRKIVLYQYVGIAFCVMIISCTNSYRHNGLSAKNIDESNIRNLAIGMKVEGVVNYCGPLPMSKIPVYRYPAKDGGMYFFYFVPTNEFELPVTANDGFLHLTAITKVESKYWPKNFEDYFINFNPYSNQYYILPYHLEGKRFTGLP